MRNLNIIFLLIAIALSVTCKKDTQDDPTRQTNPKIKSFTQHKPNISNVRNMLNILKLAIMNQDQKTKLAMIKGLKRYKQITRETIIKELENETDPRIKNTFERIINEIQ